MRGSVLAAMLVLVLFAVWGAPGARAGPRVEQTYSGSIVDAKTGAPIDGVTVVFQGAGAPVTLAANGTFSYAARIGDLQSITVTAPEYATYANGIGFGASGTLAPIRLTHVAPDIARWFAQVNADRKRFGAMPIVLDELLTEAAQAQADEQTANGYFSHWDREGRDPTHQCRDARFASRCAQNIAVTTSASVLAVEKRFIEEARYCPNPVGYAGCVEDRLREETDRPKPGNPAAVASVVRAHAEGITSDDGITKGLISQGFTGEEARAAVAYYTYVYVDHKSRSSAGVEGQTGHFTNIINPYTSSVGLARSTSPNAAIFPGRRARTSVFVMNFAPRPPIGKSCCVIFDAKALPDRVTPGATVSVTFRVLDPGAFGPFRTDAYGTGCPSQPIPLATLRAGGLSVTCRRTPIETRVRRDPEDPGLITVTAMAPDHPDELDIAVSSAVPGTLQPEAATASILVGSPGRVDRPS